MLVLKAIAADMDMPNHEKTLKQITDCADVAHRQGRRADACLLIDMAYRLLDSKPISNTRKSDTIVRHSSHFISEGVVIDATSFFREKN